MKSQLYWQHIDNPNKPDLVLLHGWGTNSQIWSPIVEQFKQDYSLHLVDLPGYGNNKAIQLSTLSEMSESIYQQAPKNAFWLGWSLGGLIATNVALQASLNSSASIRGLITVASSPCFMANDNWSGLSPKTLEQFEASLQHNKIKTLKRFIALQCMGDQHEKAIQQILLSTLDDEVSLSTLQSGLTLLKQTDLKGVINQINIPYLQIFGDKDKIVPVTIATENSHIIESSAHLPFLSNPNQFIQIMNHFVNC